MIPATCRYIASAAAAAPGVLYFRHAITGDARWWNLVMAGMLLSDPFLYLHQRG